MGVTVYDYKKRLDPEETHYTTLREIKSQISQGLPWRPGSKLLISDERSSQRFGNTD